MYELLLVLTALVFGALLSDQLVNYEVDRPKRALSISGAVLAALLIYGGFL